MDQLPLELVSLIVSHLDYATLGPYARVSRQWQVAVENLTFRRVHVQSTELDVFARMFSLVHRRAALDTLVYHVLLPEYSEDRMAKFERRRDRETNNEVFSAAVHELLSLLKSWESPSAQEELAENGRITKPSPSSSTNTGRRIALHLGAYSLTDIARPRPQDDLEEHRYEKSILTLLDSTALPEVERVTGFSCPGDCKFSTRTLRAASVARIASTFPRIERMDLGLEDCAFSENTIRHKYRTEFAKALLTIRTQHLKHFYLRFEFADITNETFHFPSGTDPNNPTVDDLSLALHTFISRSPSLIVIILGGPIVLSPTIFTGPPPPTPSSPPATKPCPPPQPPVWPRLHTLIFQLSRTMPNAPSWLFTHDPNDSYADQFDRSDTEQSGSVTSPFSGSNNPIDSDDSMFHDTYHAYHDGVAVGQRPRRQVLNKLENGRWEPFVTAATEAVLLERGVRAPALHELKVMVTDQWDEDPCVIWRCDDRGLRGKRVRHGSSWQRNGVAQWEPSREVEELWREWIGEGGCMTEDESRFWLGEVPEKWYNVKCNDERCSFFVPSRF